MPRTCQSFFKLCLSSSLLACRSIHGRYGMITKGKWPCIHFGFWYLQRSPPSPRSPSRRARQREINDRLIRRLTRPAHLGLIPRGLVRIEKVCRRRSFPYCACPGGVVLLLHVKRMRNCSISMRLPSPEPQCSSASPTCRNQFLNIRS